MVAPTWKIKDLSALICNTINVLRFVVWCLHEKTLWSWAIRNTIIIKYSIMLLTRISFIQICSNLKNVCIFSNGIIIQISFSLPGNTWCYYDYKLAKKAKLSNLVINQKWMLYSPNKHKGNWYFLLYICCSVVVH